MSRIDEEIEELNLRIMQLQQRKIEMQVQHDDFDSLANNICVKDIDKRYDICYDLISFNSQIQLQEILL